MTPAISRGDHFIMEGFTFLLRSPKRGDIIVLKTDGIASLPAGGIYIKRVAGLPGERLHIADGKLYVNDTNVALKNQAGEISYVPVRGARYLTASVDILTVPDGHYFVLGDSSADSADSRTWGCVPAKNIMGRASLRYWPPARIGVVR
jgi:signal peptidase I